MAGAIGTAPGGNEGPIRDSSPDRKAQPRKRPVKKDHEKRESAKRARSEKTAAKRAPVKKVSIKKLVGAKKRARPPL